VALEPKRHKNKVQRLQILETVATAHRHTGTPVRSILKELGLPRASYYRYLKAAEPKKRKPRIKAPPLTPPERCIIRDVALAHPTTGYKRLTWTMQNEELAGVRAYQVLGMLREEELIHRRGAAVPSQNKKPEEPTLPNQVWHIDLMYLWLRNRWWYLVDILDGYSRYLVHWTLNDTMEAEL